MNAAPAWQLGKLHLPVELRHNGQRVGLWDAAAGMHWHFGQLLACLAQTHRLGAGSIVGSGTLSDASGDTARSRRCNPTTPCGWS